MLEHAAIFGVGLVLGLMVSRMARLYRPVLDNKTTVTPRPEDQQRAIFDGPAAIDAEGNIVPASARPHPMKQPYWGSYGTFKKDDLKL